MFFYFVIDPYWTFLKVFHFITNYALILFYFYLIMTESGDFVGGYWVLWLIMVILLEKV